MNFSGSQRFSSNNYAYDNASGSYSEPFLTTLEEAIQSNLTNNVNIIKTTCFIPTISALDLNININSSFELKNSNCNTIFDYIHASKSSNIDHFQITTDAVGFILTHLNTVEKPDIFNFDSENIDISENLEVLHGSAISMSASNNIENSNTVTIKSGGQLSLIAGQSIELNTGFSVELGGLLSASIIHCNTDFNPHHVAPNLKSVIKNSIEFNEFNCTNIGTMENYSPDSTYNECTNEIENTEYQQFLSDNIIVYPNPTSGFVTIELSENINSDNLTIRVYNSMNTLINVIDPIRSNIIALDLSNSLSGLITVQFLFNNNVNTYNYSVNIVKQ